jgi:hypothetical protein
VRARERGIDFERFEYEWVVRMYHSQFRLQEKDHNINMNNFDGHVKQGNEGRGRTNEKNHLICSNSVE